MGNIIIILLYLSEDLAATSTEAVTQVRSLSSPCYYSTAGPLLPYQWRASHVIKPSELLFLLLDTFKILRLVCFLL